MRSGSSNRWRNAALLAGILAASEAFIYCVSDGRFCYLKGLVGLPCPGCGLTRAMISLFEFDFVGAFYWHPLFILVFLLAGIILLKKRRPFNTLYSSDAFWYSVLFIFITVWIIRMAVLFPDRPPMDFNRSALLMKVLFFLDKFFL
ncbi:MAG: DUF2752 domain-containing protein [Spirochaetes bacterium]|jgi:hypothetical protein|nr:DUF2752 domain-containing protein [Spirochaetota bacterium]